ncbi:uncharacterized protein LOC9661781 isoform X2 [Selaginella moellendorffii]|nr:uncharacterized protein LOC9661781 isoform X2 [Selaginella moellendorffii]|eukprot:XP_002962345.2 uncharacterized protein LOC9661781 isoform X2 [Selaginella moellendorffii]
MQLIGRDGARPESRRCQRCGIAIAIAIAIVSSARVGVEVESLCCVYLDGECDFCVDSRRKDGAGGRLGSLQNALGRHVDRAISGIHKLVNESPEIQALRSSRQSANGELPGTDSTSSSDEISWKDLYRINWTPKELRVKFRQQMEGYQLGANFEFDGIQEHGCNTKIVLKPVGNDPKWKLMFEPKQGDIRLITRKIPIGPLLSFQVGLGHDFRSRKSGWKWRVTSSLGDCWPAQIKQKTRLAICPGFDVRVGWNAEYVLPDVHGSMGVGEPPVGLDLGHLSASLDRVEAIFTHAT